ncbi:MAG: 4-hydroxybenzoate polyprenyltransferase [Devosia sp.]|uniref:4-hydroxybenzoate octaprenyltransferase n=1 Tax=Devosia sp. TaxID=1871048 RepID=UPI002626DF33|nr:4-hydroxybenzoate octaprenyltransferase [Devosia sp.]MDB5542450.1 4-hydroxybenzoate polyprenyltransferase [Devosia sp.]
MQTTDKTAGAVADASRDNWVDRYAPEWLKPYARLARWDRPIGFWLLFWPCAFSLALATLKVPANGFDWRALILCFVGAVAMRGAGCTFNDIVDTDIDMKVARTRSRPIPSGQVSKRQAALFLVLQALVGLVVLLQFNALTVLLGVASLVLIAIYPFMKRVTWWPQLFLGLAFSWGALIGWTSQTSALSLPPVLLYLGTILWTIGYDTIYALQDVEDDALIGVRSTARLFGRRARLFVALFYAGTVALWVAAALMVGAGWPFLAGMLVVIGVFGWQIRTLQPKEPANALVRFKANHWVGLAFTLAMLADWVV